MLALLLISPLFSLYSPRDRLNPSTSRLRIRFLAVLILENPSVKIRVLEWVGA